MKKWLAGIFLLSVWRPGALAACLAGGGQRCRHERDERRFLAGLKPIFAKYCVQLSRRLQAKAHLALDAFKDEGTFWKNAELLDKIQEKIRAREMPPQNKPQPNEAERKLLTGWIDAKLAKLSQSGSQRDPGGSPSAD